jgi:octaprenyl-diphosphate synthase
MTSFLDSLQENVGLRPVGSLEEESTEVQQQLYGAIDELFSPLGDLVRAQLQHSLSPQRIAIILTAGTGATDSAVLRRQRILLAAALEMLCLALTVHRALFRDTRTNNQSVEEKSWVGSIILAGDYCFSRAAIFAAHTDHPRVVETFARALKLVSEGHLRHFFSMSTLYDENHELMQAGLTAATLLASVDPKAAAVVLRLGKEVAQQVISNVSEPNLQLLTPLVVQLTEEEQARWRYLFSWCLTQSRAVGLGR